MKHSFCEDWEFTRHWTEAFGKGLPVPKQEIVDNSYDLSINKYKQVEYTPVEYPPTSEILKELRDLEAEISRGLDELEGMM